MYTITVYLNNGRSRTERYGCDTLQQAFARVFRDSSVVKATCGPHAAYRATINR